jgi:hypothetical protein
VSRRPQDKPQTKLRMQSRRARALQLFKQGKSTREASRILKSEGFPKVSQSTVSCDLRALQADFAEIVPQERQAAYEELKGLKDLITRADDLKTGEAIKLLLETHDRLSRLLGLDAPIKTVKANIDATVDPAQLQGYRRFVVETQLLSLAQLEEVYKYARSLRPAPSPINLSLKGEEQ